MLKNLYVMCCVVLLLAAASCSERTAPVTIPVEESAVFTVMPVWYGVCNQAVSRVTSPAAMAPVEVQPWTQSPCITAAVCSGDSSFFLINKTGIAEFCMTAQNGGIQQSLWKWDSRFNEATAASLYFYNGIPVVRLYRNTFFAKDNEIESEIPPFIAWNRTTGLFSPLGFDKQLFFPHDGAYELTAVEKSSGGYCALFKNDTGTEISFVYRALEENSVPTARGYVHRYAVSDISADEYKKRTEPLLFADAPESLSRLLAYLQNVPFKVSLSIVNDTAAGAQSEPGMIFCNGDIGGDVPEGFAVIADRFQAALFSDGTFFYSAAGGSPVAARLPRPLENMWYQRFMIVGTTLFAAWEERVFYEVGRTGFVQVDMGSRAFASQSRLHGSAATIEAIARSE